MTLNIASVKLKNWLWLQVLECTLARPVFFFRCLIYANKVQINDTFGCRLKHFGLRYFHFILKYNQRLFKPKPILARKHIAVCIIQRVGWWVGVMYWALGETWPCDYYQQKSYGAELEPALFNHNIALLFKALPSNSLWPANEMCPDCWLITSLALLSRIHTLTILVDIGTLLYTSMMLQ